jgi:hypothetical protein
VLVVVDYQVYLRIVKDLPLYKEMLQKHRKYLWLLVEVVAEDIVVNL